MKHFIFITLISLFAACTVTDVNAQAGKGAFIIFKGSFAPDSIKQFTWVFAQREGEGRDSALIKDGHFTLKVPFSSPVAKRLDFTTGDHGVSLPVIYLIDKPGTYTLTGSISINNGLQYCRLLGSVSDSLFRSFQHLYSAAGRTGTEVTDFIKNHRDNYAAAYILYQYGDNMQSMETVEQLYDQLTTSVRTTNEGQTVYKRINSAKNMQPGSTLADFTLPDDKDKPVSLSSFKGKYVILDFWASWCHPCRMSFPHMREVYQHYKDKGLVICSISIDKYKSDWLKAVAEEKNPWVQLLDNKSLAQDVFALRGVPTQMLISPEGKILLTTIGYDETKDEIADKLSSLLKD